jgi:stringent starvation protein B
MQGAGQVNGAKCRIHNDQWDVQTLSTRGRMGVLTHHSSLITEFVMPERSTKPYLIRAIHQWCSDSGFTPYVSVKVDASTRVPAEYVKDGEIVLNVGYDATHRLTIGDETIQFAGRFNGVSHECSIPIAAVLGIFARENGKGLYFPPEEAVAGASSPEPAPEPPGAPPNGSKPKLQVVK